MGVGSGVCVGVGVGVAVGTGMGVGVGVAVGTGVRVGVDVVSGARVLVGCNVAVASGRSLHADSNVNTSKHNKPIITIAWTGLRIFINVTACQNYRNLSQYPGDIITDIPHIRLRVSKEPAILHDGDGRGIHERLQLSHRARLLSIIGNPHQVANPNRLPPLHQVEAREGPLGPGRAPLGPLRFISIADDEECNDESNSSTD